MFAAVSNSVVASAASGSPMANLVALLWGLAAIILAVSVAVALLVALPTLRALAVAAWEVGQLARVLREEAPELAAALRLAALETSDAIGDIGDLGMDLSSGVRATAQSIAMAKAGLEQVPGAVEGVGQQVRPIIRDQVLKPTKDSLEGRLRENARLNTCTAQAVAHVAANVGSGAKKASSALGVLRAAQRLAQQTRQRSPRKASP